MGWVTGVIRKKGKTQNQRGKSPEKRRRVELPQFSGGNSWVVCFGGTKKCVRKDRWNGGGDDGHAKNKKPLGQKFEHRGRQAVLHTEPKIARKRKERKKKMCFGQENIEGL